MTKWKSHPISKYMDRFELTNTDFAEKLGVTRQRVSQIINQPGGTISVKLARKIVEITAGEVKYDDLFNWVPMTKAKKRAATKAGNKPERASTSY
jgi:DNA-binding XRE family transcriptional regulator|tara:strand:- start:10 stop:294 length:285 start_codon:yes stop_codon:yes gene_type:complete